RSGGCSATGPRAVRTQEEPRHGRPGSAAIGPGGGLCLVGLASNFEADCTSCLSTKPRGTRSLIPLGLHPTKYRLQLGGGVGVVVDDLPSPSFSTIDIGGAPFSLHLLSSEFALEALRADRVGRIVG